MTTDLKSLKIEHDWLLDCVRTYNNRLTEVRISIGQLLSPFATGKVVRRKAGLSHASKLFVVVDAISYEVENESYKLNVRKIDEKKDTVEPTTFTFLCRNGSLADPSKLFEVCTEFTVDRDKLIRAVPKRIRAGFQPYRISDNVGIIDRIMRPQIENGCDFSTTHRHVLLRKGKQELIWTGGRSYSSGRETKYAESELGYFDYRNTGLGSGMGATWHSGGRLSTKLLKTFDEKIRETFDIDFNLSEVWNSKGTVVIYE
jgi:hypothetical protein